MPNDEHLLDNVDIAILDLLQLDSSIPNSELAVRVGLSPSACLARTKSLRGRGILREFTAIVDQEKVALTVSTFTFVTLSKHSRRTAEAFLKRVGEMPQVMECYNVTGQADYLLKIVAPDMVSYRDFIIDKLIEVSGVAHVETMVVLKTEKRSFSLPLTAPTVGRKK